MGKIEKLKEIKNTINNICHTLETRIFIENVDIECDDILKSEHN